LNITVPRLGVEKSTLILCLTALLMPKRTKLH